MPVKQMLDGRRYRGANNSLQAVYTEVNRE